MAGLLFDPASLNEKAKTKLKDAEAMMAKWSKNLNIVSPEDRPHLWERHFVDSLQLIPSFNEVNKLADMGSGFGFPSVPLAIACPDIDVFAIEVIAKKTALISEIVRELRLPNLHVLNERVEKVFLSHMDVVTCRALGEFSRDAKLAYKMLKPSGHFMTFKTAPEEVLPEGYAKVGSEEYRLPGFPRRYFVVVAEKAGET